MDLYDFPYIGSGKSSQLTFSPSFFRGVVLFHHQPDGNSLFILDMNGI